MVRSTENNGQARKEIRSIIYLLCGALWDVWYLHGRYPIWCGTLYDVSTCEGTTYQLPAWETFLDIMKRSVGYHMYAGPVYQISTWETVLDFMSPQEKQSCCTWMGKSHVYQGLPWESVLGLKYMHGNGLKIMYQCCMKTWIPGTHMVWSTPYGKNPGYHM